MTLDSKDSDIEQLRSQLQALHIGLDSSSIGSGLGDAEAEDGFPGAALPAPRHPPRGPGDGAELHT